MNGDVILKQIERGLADAGIEGRITDVSMETHSAPLRSMGGTLAYVGLGCTMTLKIEIESINVLKPGSSFQSTEFAPPVRAIARAGEDV